MRAADVKFAQLENSIAISTTIRKKIVVPLPTVCSHNKVYASWPSWAKSSLIDGKMESKSLMQQFMPTIRIIPVISALMVE